MRNNEIGILAGSTLLGGVIGLACMNTIIDATFGINLFPHDSIAPEDAWSSFAEVSGVITIIYGGGGLGGAIGAAIGLHVIKATQS